ncbi:MAG TPA: NAD-dependent epimerase/dehydratase family protein [Candidatus Dormibacteraeota bacterium]|nr:NAD-dependent epimerase/dehydratase family protein [Candidatus Dormibacteraeota bacterium]
MRVVVLGGTRFIGRAIVEELAGAGHEILIVHRGNLEPDGMPPVKHLHAERMELPANRDELAAFQPDAAIDCRALTRADSEVALGALPDGLRLVVVSSIDVYRAFGAVNEERETDPVPIDEDSPVRSNRYPYRGQMPGMDDYDKLDVEDVYLSHGATSVRLPMVYGEHDYQLREDYILRRVRAGRSRIPTGAGMWLASRAYVRDVARGVHLALTTPAAAGQVLNLCEDRTYSMRLWSGMILDAAESDAELVRVADELLPEDLKPTGTMTQHIAASAHKARSMLGWTTSDPVESLRSSVRWHLANPPPNPDPDFSADDLALASV